MDAGNLPIAIDARVAELNDKQRADEESTTVMGL